jgi:hypothetical protein
MLYVTSILVGNAELLAGEVLAKCFQMDIPFQRVLVREGDVVAVHLSNKGTETKWAGLKVLYVMPNGATDECDVSRELGLLKLENGHVGCIYTVQLSRCVLSRIIIDEC